MLNLNLHPSRDSLDLCLPIYRRHSGTIRRSVYRSVVSGILCVSILSSGLQAYADEAHKKATAEKNTALSENPDESSGSINGDAVLTPVPEVPEKNPVPSGGDAAVSPSPDPVPDVSGDVQETSGGVAENNNSTGESSDNEQDLSEPSASATEPSEGGSGELNPDLPEHQEGGTTEPGTDNGNQDANVIDLNDPSEQSGQSGTEPGNTIDITDGAGQDSGSDLSHEDSTSETSEPVPTETPEPVPSDNADGTELPVITDPDPVVPDAEGSDKEGGELVFLPTEPFDDGTVSGTDGGELSGLPSYNPVILTGPDDIITIDITHSDPSADMLDTDVIDMNPSAISSDPVFSSSVYNGGYTGGYTYNGNVYYPGYQYNPMTRDAWLSTLTPYEQLLVDMTKTEKVPAVVGGTLSVDIKEGRGDAFRTVGTLPAGGLCYVLEEGEWAYIESGQVRGFVRTSDLLYGTDASGIFHDVPVRSMQKAVIVIAPQDNAAFSYLMTTTSVIPEMPSYNSGDSGIQQVNRSDVVAYAREKATSGSFTDAIGGEGGAGFLKDVYSHFGILLPATVREQAYVGERISPSDLRPGDVIIYGADGAPEESVIYLGDGKVAGADSDGIPFITDADYERILRACRVIQDIAGVSTQASDLVIEGRKAAEGDELARENVIEALADASEEQWDEYGFPRSVLIAHTILESNWVSFGDEGDGGVVPGDNNVLGMNVELHNDDWSSPWEGDFAERAVPDLESGEVVYGNEMMRTYTSIEECMTDFAAFKTGLHPDVSGETDVNIVLEECMLGNATDPDYQAAIKKLINKYDLTQYDESKTSWNSANSANPIRYSREQLELIWAIVAQEDDKSYEGALAVITTAMNRADINYGGHGTDALSQLTADGQFCYSASVSDPIYYQRRLGGNVPEYVKQAVSDCLEHGRRNHSFKNFRSSNRTGTYTQVGSNWYF